MRCLALFVTIFFTCASGALAASPPTSASPAAGSGAPFLKTLELHGIRFVVSADYQSPTATVTITPSGLEIDNSPVTRSIDWRVKDAEVADLDVDRSPEIYVYLTSDTGDSLVALSANKRKSLSDIDLPPLDETPGAMAGYRGRDAFAVGEGRLLRRFPIYRDGDSDAEPTGGMRQLQYRLEPGEAGWRLVVDQVLAY
ncbi:exported hypothetical protein [Thiocapsa sp. KS1]|nr:hypothetical protein [Thiocapsa sp. KS1]CRI66271.1 exported hypothetical protein [Thiocapsa sp. KS1]